ncbi:UNVERIFIED_CONTAM: hypothetical protein Sindi_2947000 [Sesamum indicum]
MRLNCSCICLQKVIDNYSKSDLGPRSRAAFRMNLYPATQEGETDRVYPRRGYSDAQVSSGSKNFVMSHLSEVNCHFPLGKVLEPGDDTCRPVLLASINVSLRVLYPMMFNSKERAVCYLLLFCKLDRNLIAHDLHIQSASDRIPRIVSPPVALEGPSRVKTSRRRRHTVHEEEHDSEETHTYARFQSMLEQNPWSGIVSSVKQQIHSLKEKYFIPHSYELVIPRSFDRMHHPPKGFCSFSLHHFDAGLRLPLAPPIAHILTRLNLCPMQLSPNSIRHIILFIIVMKHRHLEPSIENFWSLYSFTTSTRFADRGFLEPLTSNVGPWKKKFVCVRPPSGRVWPFRLDWVLEKPNPIIEGGGLEGDLINSLTSYRYDLKKLLVEEVLWLARLTPASLQVGESLDSMVNQARITQCIRAAQARAAARQVALVAPAITPFAASTQPELEQSVANIPNERAPIEVVSGDTRSGGLRGGRGSPVRSHADESSAGVTTGRRRRRSKSPERPDTRSRSFPFRGNLQSESACAEEARNMELFNNISECWKKAREELRSPHHLSAQLNGDKLVPDWKISSTSTVLGTLSGQDSWEMYEAICPPHDQAALLKTSFIRLEEYSAHSLIQAPNFAKALSLKCAGFRRNQLLAEQKNKDLGFRNAEMSGREHDLEKQRSSLEARNKELEERMSSEIAKAMEAGKEIRFSTGHADGKIAGSVEGRENFLKSDEFAGRIKEARIQGARDFMKAPAFESALEIKAADYVVQGFERCKSQVATLGGFAPDFDISKLDPRLEGSMQPFPEEDAPLAHDDEFPLLLDELEDN